MLVSFLFPYPIRYTPAPFLWVFYKQLGSFLQEDMIYVGSKDYFTSPNHFVAQDRWEVRQEYHPSLDYRIPFQSEVTESNHFILNNAIFSTLEKKFLSPNLVWRYLMLENYEPLHNAFFDILSNIRQKTNIDAVLSWCNCPSIELAASRLGIPVIHNEIGPLRPPTYVPTAYFDFQGVNGGTEARKRFHQLPIAEKVQLFDRQELISIVTLDQTPPPAFETSTNDSIGVALQLSDDSNTVAFSNGFDSLELLRYAQYLFPSKKLLIRPHPQDFAPPNIEHFGVRDSSASAEEFIAKCETIVTINSSLGFEALLLGKRVLAIGDCFYGFLADPRTRDAMGKDEVVEALCLLTLGYLMPYEKLFEREYYLWRLGFPSEEEIYARHLALYRLP